MDLVDAQGHRTTAPLRATDYDPLLLIIILSRILGRVLSIYCGGDIIIRKGKLCRIIRTFGI